MRERVDIQIRRNKSAKKKRKTEVEKQRENIGRKKSLYEHTVHSRLFTTKCLTLTALDCSSPYTGLYQCC
jgi:hypothetical protein